MTNMTRDENDTIASNLLQQLSQTPYACSSLSQPLSSRDGNLVYRDVLATPLQDGTAMVKSVIIKHSTTTDSSEPKNKIFEEVLLNALTLARFSPSTDSSIVVVRTPRLYLYDPETNMQIIEDFVNTTDLKTILFSPNAQELLLSSSPGHDSSSSSVGYNLGFWLRAFHTWSSTSAGPETASLRAQMWRNDSMRKFKYRYTYDSVLRVLGKYPEILLKGFEGTLEDFRDGIAEEFGRASPSFIEGEKERGKEEYGLTHGDFWMGNILLRNPPPVHMNNPSTTDLFIIDWEFAHYGHRSTDLGQILGDLYERSIYNNLGHITLPIMEEVVNGYGLVSEEMAFRTAVYVGVHLVSYFDRRPRRGPRAVGEDVLVDGLRVGRDFIVKGWEGDKDFFVRGPGGALGSLFRGEESM